MTDYVANFSFENNDIEANYELDNPQLNAELKIDIIPDIRSGSPLIGVDKLNERVTITSKTFVFEQATPLKVWQIEHNLNKRPSCFAVDSGGNMWFPDEIDYVDDNNIVVTFIAPFAGQAYLN